MVRPATRKVEMITPACQHEHMDEVDARNLSEHHLAGTLPRRWRHVQAVAIEATRLCETLQVSHGVVLAAWLHDIGYGPSILDTGFHPLDGARFLRSRGWDDEVCCLVAHHSDAANQADPHLGIQLRAEFAEVDGLARDILWTADATTGPDGQYVTLDERIAEITDRYGADHPVAVRMTASRAALAAAIARTTSALAAPSTKVRRDA